MSVCLQELPSPEVRDNWEAPPKRPWSPPLTEASLPMGRQIETCLCSYESSPAHQEHSGQSVACQSLHTREEDGRLRQTARRVSCSVGASLFTATEALSPTAFIPVLVAQSSAQRPHLVTSPVSPSCLKELTHPAPLAGDRQRKALRAYQARLPWAESAK